MNILITGTPGTGKTTVSKLLANNLKMNHIDVSEMIKADKLYCSYDQDFDSYLIDEEKLLESLRPLIRRGNLVIDTHQCAMFPPIWFDMVVVLTTGNTILYDRLKARGYSDLKIEENIDCEIMSVVSEEAFEIFGDKKVFTLENKLFNQIGENVSKITERLAKIQKEIVELQSKDITDI